MAKSKKDWEEEAARHFEGTRRFEPADEPKERQPTRREVDDEIIRNFEGPRRYEW